MHTKTCLQCDVEKPLDDFNRWKLSKDGRQGWCRECQKVHNSKYMAGVGREKARQSYEANKPARLAAAKKWGQANPERRREIQRAWRLRNLEQVRQRSMESWKRNYSKPANRETARQSHRKWKARKREAPINDLTTQQWLDIIAAHDHRCAYCAKECQLTQDHVIPLSRGGSHTASNVVPACLNCNSQKRTRTPAEWQPSPV